MSTIASVFAGKKDKVLIAYITAGYPTLQATLEAVPLLESCGVDLVELGIPFSDPLADGITIQQAGFQSLRNGITPAACLEAARLIRQKTDLPLLFMTYYNPVLAYGPALFCAEAAQAGIGGLIIPDLPPEEAGAVAENACRHRLDLIHLLAPNSTDERIRVVAERAGGFIYLVSLTGVTGVRQELSPGLEKLAARVRKFSQMPLCAGFGISTPQQAAKAAEYVDGVIVGSSIVQRMGSGQYWQRDVAAFACSLKQALRSAQV